MHERRAITAHYLDLTGKYDGQDLVILLNPLIIISGLRVIT